MRERDDNAVSRAHEPEQLVLRLGEAPGRYRRPLRLELKCLPPRERVELGGAVEGHRRQAFLLPDRTHLVGLPDEIGWAIDGRDQVARLDDPCVGVVLPAVRPLRVDALAAPLGGGVDPRIGDRMQGPLGERREGPHLLDLVAEQLHPQRLPPGRGEHVDDPSSDGELTALIDAIDALVARARERLGQSVEARLLADREANGLGAVGKRGHPLRKRRCRRAYEPAGSEHIERPRPLTDEVRRRLEARRVRDAAAREQGNPVGAEEPRRALRRVAGVCVLGQHDQEPAPELLVQRREDERERRLRDAGPAGQGLRECLEPVAGRELCDEGVKGRLVHANSGKRGPAGLS